MSSLGSFGWLDWTVVALVLVGTTLLGERLAGRQDNLRDYFLGGRRLPWWAVAASIVATEISALTFLSLPFLVYAGDLTYLQLGIGSLLIAKVVVGVVLVPRYFERELYSPYDLIGARLGEGARRVASGVFLVGGVLGQAARVYLTALVLELLLYDELLWVEARTGLPPLAGAVAAIGVVAVAWTWIGGMAAVVWTDTILFLLLVFGLTLSLVVAVRGVDGGLDAVFSAARDAGKLRLWNASLDLREPYTLWAALFAYVPFTVGVFGTDQLLTQRLFCCADARGARRAVIASNAASAVTALAALVGLALFAYYAERPLAGEAARLVAEQGDRVFPIFILQALPAGLKGLVIAGVFAAAISSLDSILAALAQVTLTTCLPEKSRGVAASRWLVLAYGVALCALAIWMRHAAVWYPSILDLALAMMGFTVGALLAGVLLAMWPLGRDGSGYRWSAPLSVCAVVTFAWLPEDPLAWPWRAPVGLAVAWGAGWLLSRRVSGY